MAIEVRVPDLGSFKDVTVIDLLVKPGETVEIDTSLVTLETEKATMDVPSSAAGVVEAVHVARGGKVNSGDLVVTLRASEGAAAATPAAAAPASADTAATVAATPVAAPAAAAAPATQTPAPAAAASAAPAVAAATAGGSSAAATRIPGGRTDLAPIDEPGFSTAHAGPSVRRLARELGVDLSKVKGSGLKGRISHEDVKAHVKRLLAGGGTAGGGGAGLPRVAAVDFAAFGPVEVNPLSRVQKISGPRLHAAWVNLPHVTQFDEADITGLEEARKRLKDTATERGIKLTPLAFIIRAVVRTLAEFPTFNASLDESGQNLVLKRYCHIGFAADTPNGLLVPVIRDADRKDVYAIARALGELSAKARAGKLSGAEMQGGCFTVSSLGGIGGTAFTPIINAPEVAILGVSRSATKPVWQDGAFVPRLTLPLSLSYDHRVIDGALGARFTTHLAAQLADVRGLLEAVP
ncbi:MAG: 2-oxo acid dehydrogenase subunit E2 [Steroidobacteraceae bacterium]|nr:2-oxo acid dehydrogenase subunit E2 [Nevskiaceae bacterium]MCP5339011.1 2-oxo acid dehydrogenase subunit E2 [Nevskiaceae bacterium]MCP5359577.1 2-oxo acid dehydrogenase subunit E2 [Nevskiaceae bacterium]MCP5473023.1 2-oxo acid dehydrogenase subunit E2 [Nevskiaceae bacterium]